MWDSPLNTKKVPEVICHLEAAPLCQKFSVKAGSSFLQKR
jgi:hypothetical protein